MDNIDTTQQPTPQQPKTANPAPAPEEKTTFSLEYGNVAVNSY